MIDKASLGPMWRIFWPSGLDRMWVLMATRYRSGSCFERGKTGRPGRTVRKGDRGEDVRCVRVTVIGEATDGNMTCDGGALGVDTRLVLNVILWGLEFNEDCVGGCCCGD